MDVHNVVDYVEGSTLVAAPWLFGFADVPRARNTFMSTGLGLIGYSLLTRYRYSLAKVIPIGVHMALDASSASFLMVSPWVVGYRRELKGSQLALNFVFGLATLGLVAFTKPKTEKQLVETYGTSELEKAA